MSANNNSIPQQPLEAIILAGGLGTRLRSVVADLPKCMAPVNGVPFLAFIIKALQQQGVIRFIFSLGYKNENIIDYMETHYPALDKVYVIEKEQLGTGGAIKESCKAAQQPSVIVVNGDTLFDVNLQELYDIHTKQKAACTLALKPMEHFSRYGVVETNNQAHVTAFREKQYRDKGMINGGVYALDVQRFLRDPLPDIFSFEKEYLEKNTGSNKLYGIAFDAYFIDIGIPEDYERAQKELHLN
ncbi:MAG: nucleotidyltransferase family protein [Bacteroidetes bacterium]|nr:nucleotidyltransferase family protein [Bacteroidota bacterium]